jgi:hypothetical protein
MKRIIAGAVTADGFDPFSAQMKMNVDRLSHGDLGRLAFVLPAFFAMKGYLILPFDGHIDRMRQTKNYGLHETTV